MAGFFGGQEIVILFILGFIIFGAKKIPELGYNLGLFKGQVQRGLQENMSSAGTDIDRGGMTEEHQDESE
jgi:Sec-independent protein translocase protein TatA|tara:strand:- start:1672 stop:1881 length:210 start_codon:yes stop_codon:yes gene_type:complete